MLHRFCATTTPFCLATTHPIYLATTPPFWHLLSLESAVQAADAPHVADHVPGLISAKVVYLKCVLNCSTAMEANWSGSRLELAVEDIV